MGASLIALGALSLDSYAVRFNGQFNLIGLDATIAKQKHMYVHNFIVTLFACNFILLGFIGARPVEEPYLSVGFMLTLSYFFFLEILVISGLIIRKNDKS
jgi:quinol-cytochrome oxidoreductase complex cytochrome b subunit